MRGNYRYAMSLTTQFYFCGVPFRLDTTPKCSINCSYCFAMANRGRNTSPNMIADPKRIIAKLKRTFDVPEDVRDANGHMLLMRVPVHFGGMSDPFSMKEASKISREILLGLKEYDYPVILSTKNADELLNPHTMDILRGMSKLVIQISFCTSNSELASRIEPHASSPMKRVQAIETLSRLGFHVMVRLQPMMPPLRQQYIDELIPMVGEAGAKHVIVEFLKLSLYRNRSTMGEVFDALDWDGYEHYRKNGAIRVGPEWLLPNEMKWNDLQPLISAIHSYGMTYGSADYGLHHLGDTMCCCGTDKVEGFSQWYQGNLASVIRNAPFGKLDVGLVDQYWQPDGSIRAILNSNCRQDDKSTIRDYLLGKWNRPGTENAPDSFLGVFYNNEVDNSGNCVYEKAVVQ